MDFWPEEKGHVLRLELVGQSDRSKGNFVGLVSILLRERRPRVKTYGHDKDKDWKKDPVLY
jgi:hypothetical protein